MAAASANVRAFGQTAQVSVRWTRDWKGGGFAHEVASGTSAEVAKVLERIAKETVVIESAITQSAADGSYQVETAVRQRAEKREKDAADAEAQVGATLAQKRQRMYRARAREKLISKRKEGRQQLPQVRDKRALRIVQLNCNSIDHAMAAEAVDVIGVYNCPSISSARTAFEADWLGSRAIVCADLNIHHRSWDPHCADRTIKDDRKVTERLLKW
eukprot:gene2431-8519_t